MTPGQPVVECKHHVALALDQSPSSHKVSQTNGFKTLEHLLKVLLDDREGLAANLLRAAGADPQKALASIEAELAKLDAESARQAIRTDLAAFLRDEVRRHGCRLSGAEVDGLLENDVALNTDGLLVWLSRRKS